MQKEKEKEREKQKKKRKEKEKRKEKDRNFMSTILKALSPDQQSFCITQIPFV